MLADAGLAARVEMLDLGAIDANSLVTRKDVYMNGAQSGAAFQRAGITRGREKETSKAL
jgi:hypothetical protein